MDVNTEYLGLTLFGEARGEPIEGIIGVGSVIRNRVQLRFMNAKSYSDVCRAHEQFSCWNTNDLNYPVLMSYKDMIDTGQVVNDIFFRQCLFIANGIINWDLRDNTRGATHYVSTTLYHSQTAPLWVSTAKKMIELGNHTFLIAH